jgi:trigger factor
MQTTVEETDRHVVRLSVEVPSDEVARDLDSAYRKVAREVKIPGFRKGKVPRQIIDARIGREHVVHQFLDTYLPEYYLQAVRENDLAPIADPEIDMGDVEDGKPLTFTATVEVRPRLTLEPSQYKGMRVDAPATEPTEQEIDEYVDRLRDRYAELEVVSRPARTGDYVIADVQAHIHDRVIPEATQSNFMTEVGSSELVPELDAELEGKRSGEILKFNATLPDSFGEAAGEEVAFQVLVKEVKAKRLPEANDEFATTASEFDTLDALREDVRSKMREFKEQASKAEVRDLVLGAVVDGVDVDLPERLVDEDTEGRIRSATRRAEAAGTTLDELLAAQGWDELQFRADARSHAIRGLKADLVLEAVARQEDLTVTDEDMAREIGGLAEASGRDPKEVVRVLERTGQVGSLAGDIIRTKALDLMVEAADVTSEGASTTPDPEPDEARVEHPDHREDDDE